MTFRPSQDGGVRVLPAGELIIISAHASPSSVARFDTVDGNGTIIYADPQCWHLLCAQRPDTVRCTRWVEADGRELGMMHCTEPAYLAYRGGLWIPPGTYTYAERGWRRGL
jgi:hypothetical protein